MPDCFLIAGESPIPINALAPDRLSDLKGQTAQWVKAIGFTASAGEIAVVPDRAGALAEVLLGLGAGNEPLLPAVLAARLPAGDYRLEGGFQNPALATLAWALGAYRFNRYRKDSGKARRLVLPDGVDGAEAARIADGVYLARDLVNTAANDLGPAELAEAARNLAARFGAMFSEIVGEGLLADNLPMIHTVGAAATEDRAPRLIEIVWGEADRPLVTVVGKGVCFDTGGLDIKSASNMALMKKDMGGAASALGLAHMIMDAKLPLRLRVLIPAVENAIAGAAFRPGDVLRSRKGLAVEIGNTDAEGRLVLADALALASEDEPDLLIDLATLTGAARFALGPDLPAVYTDDDGLATDLARHARETADPVWRMPLWRPYASMIDSKIADLNNAGSSPHAGSITAALFLSRFVGDTKRWLHADIYAWNPSSKPGRPEGGEANAIRAIYALLKERYGGR